MMTGIELRKRAQQRWAQLRKRRDTKRFRQVLGRFVHERLLVTNEEILPHNDPLRVADVLWASEAEPRLLELLPALLVKKPSMFADVDDLPDDLASVVRRLRRNLQPDDLRGISGADIYSWLPRVGRKDRVPSTRPVG